MWIFMSVTFMGVLFFFKVHDGFYDLFFYFSDLMLTEINE